MEEPKTLDTVVVTDSTPDETPAPVAKQPSTMPNFQQMLINQLNRPTVGGGANPQKALQDTIAGKQAEANLAIENAKRKEATMRPLQEAKEARIGQTEQQQAGISKELNTPFQVPQETVADFSQLGGLVGIMGVMLGTSGKMSAQNVLQSATGILDGYKKGRADLIAQKQKEFETNMKRLTALSSQIQNELKTYMDKAAVRDQTAGLSLATAESIGAGGIVAEVVKGQSAFEIQKMNQSAASLTRAAQTANTNILMQLAKDKESRQAAKEAAQRQINLAPQYQNSKGNIVQRDSVTGALPTDQGPLTRVSTPPKTGAAGASGDASVAVKEYTGATLPSKDAKEVTQIARAIGEAELLQKDVEANPELIGRSGQMGRVINRYVDSFRTGKEIEDDTSVSQEQLIFAKRYAAYLVQYERGVAGGAKGFTVALQQRFNTLLNQDQFNPSGFKNLMDQHITELASQGVAYSPKNINRQKLLDFGRDIAYNSNYGAPPAASSAAPSASATPKYTTPEQIADATTRAQAALAKATTEDQKQKIRKLYKEGTGRDL